MIKINSPKANERQIEVTLKERITYKAIRGLAKFKDDSDKAQDELIRIGVENITVDGTTYEGESILEQFNDLDANDANDVVEAISEKIGTKVDPKAKLPS